MQRRGRSDLGGGRPPIALASEPVVAPRHSNLAVVLGALGEPRPCAKGVFAQTSKPRAAFGPGWTATPARVGCCADLDRGDARCDPVSTSGVVYLDIAHPRRHGYQFRANGFDRTLRDGKLRDYGRRDRDFRTGSAPEGHRPNSARSQWQLLVQRELLRQRQLPGCVDEPQHEVPMPPRWPRLSRRDR